MAQQFYDEEDDDDHNDVEYESELVSQQTVSERWELDIELFFYLLCVTQPNVTNYCKYGPFAELWRGYGENFDIQQATQELKKYAYKIYKDKVVIPDVRDEKGMWVYDAVRRWIVHTDVNVNETSPHRYVARKFELFRAAATARTQQEYNNAL